MRIMITIKLVTGDVCCTSERDLWYGYSSPISIERIIDNNQSVIRKILSEFSNLKTYLELNGIKEEKEKKEIVNKVIQTGTSTFRSKEILNPQQFYIDKDDQEYSLGFNYSLEHLPGISPSKTLTQIREEEKKEEKEEEKTSISLTTNMITTATQENKEQIKSEFEELD